MIYIKLFSKIKSFFQNLRSRFKRSPEKKLARARARYERSKQYLEDIQNQIGAKRAKRAVVGYKRRGQRKNKAVKVNITKTLTPTTQRQRSIKQVDLESARVPIFSRGNETLETAEAVVQFKLNVAYQIDWQARVAWADPEYKAKAEQYWNNHPELWDVYDDFDDFYDWVTKFTRTEPATNKQLKKEQDEYEEFINEMRKNIWKG